MQPPPYADQADGIGWYRQISMQMASVKRTTTRRDARDVALGARHAPKSRASHLASPQIRLANHRAANQRWNASRDEAVPTRRLMRRTIDFQET
ncbi:hypothetical protein E5D57_004870 [Metarhizium anisopliae]|nr:hypothetical protein E5D57_004870 [Metarhizium anisopliae]